jgi:hypothetical protein
VPLPPPVPLPVPLPVPVLDGDEDDCFMVPARLVVELKKRRCCGRGCCSFRPLEEETRKPAVAACLASMTTASSGYNETNNDDNRRCRPAWKTLGIALLVLFHALLVHSTNNTILLLYSTCNMIKEYDVKGRDGTYTVHHRNELPRSHCQLPQCRIGASASSCGKS